MSKFDQLLAKNPVAIVGMASVFADAENLEQYWENIIEGVDCIKEIPESRWKIEDYYDPDPMAPDKTYCKVGGFLPEIDFNPMEFGLPPNILEVTDTSQLLGLSVARDALIDAGYAPGSEKLTQAVKDRTGVVLGVGGGQKLIIPLTARLQYPMWKKALRTYGMPEAQIEEVIEKIKDAYIPWTENSFPGLLGNVIAGRIANRFDLGGINSVVDAACAASLSATKMALSELIEGRCDMMITGGVDTDNSIFMYMSFSKTPAFSRKGSIRPFDHESDGMLIGEGVGMVVIKRLDDAIRDGDRIYATIKGIGSSSDGRYKSVYAPRPQGQALAMQRAYDEAGFDASTVGLIEAHGTGTGAGDLSEGKSMKMVFGKSNPKLNHIGLGSVKSQIGHTKAAAGVAGLIKAALALHHKVLPGSINVNKPNPNLDIETSPLFVNSETRPWFRKSGDLPRRAGVSAFGFGGVNVHIAMEEYTADHQTAYRQHAPHKMVLLQGLNASAVQQSCRDHVTQLQGEQGKKYLKDLANQSTETAIPANACRLGFVVSSVEEAIKKLETSIQMIGENAQKSNWEHPILGIWFRSQAAAALDKTVALFAGQGAQYVNMGDRLAGAYPEIRTAFEKANKQFESNGEEALTNVVFPIPVFSEEDRKAQQQNLNQTQFAQPAIGALSSGMFQMLKSAGFKADFFAGHSYGELTALWAAGVLDDQGFYALSKARGQAMKAKPGLDAGSMMAVKGDLQTIQSKIAGHKNIQVANINSGSQIILGGPSQELQTLMAQLKGEGMLCAMLPVSAAFHTPFVAHAQVPFANALNQVTFNSPQAPVYSNTTGLAHSNVPEEIRTSLAKHILQPVLFKNQIESIYAAGGRTFVEFGPKNILSKLVKEILGDQPCNIIALNPKPSKDSDKQLREGIVQMAVLGMPVQSFDTFLAPEIAKPTRGKLNVRISGYNHVSETTKKKYQKTLQTNNFGTLQNVPQSKETEMTPDERAILDNIQVEMQRLAAQQNRIEEMLVDWKNNQSKTNLTNTVPVTSNGNGNGNSNGNGHNIVSSTGMTKVHVSPDAVITKPQVMVQPKVVANTSGISTSEIEASLLEVIAEKTGYPAEMLELGMDLEADLGIDSIKRVEIFGAMTASNPSIQGVNPQELAELRTLNQIVEYIAGKAGATTTASAPVAAAPVSPAVVTATPTSSNGASSGISTSEIEASLLEVIAEKTGYPAEMLELGMDLEADLGIDSIKRVEIFGAMTASNPSIQGVNPQELAELRTLNQIVEYIAGKAGATTTASAPVAAAPVSPTVVTATPTSSNGASSGISTSEIEASLLEVIAEKTGYPAEMLELGMDLEADLGIDSIKRVEIFGAMTASNPSIQGVNPQELAELRTLNQIVEYIAGKAGATTTASAPVAAAPVSPAVATSTPTSTSSNGASSGVSTSEIEASLLEVIAEKTGYPAEMLELGMDLEADLGIDSIKRVEIFGAMTASNPSIQGVNPQELAELRTLNQIVEYIAGKAGATSTAAPAVISAIATPVVPTAVQVNSNGASSGISSSEIEASLLEVIAEKTGYPAEMLELGMDLEADLGIDSIKRVEIFGAMTASNPSIQGVNPQELAELRTLNQIVEYIAGKAGAVEGIVKKKHNALEETLGNTTVFANGVYPSVPRLEVVLKAIPKADQLELEVQGKKTLLVNDGTVFTSSLCEELLQKGHSVAVLTFPENLVRKGKQSLPATVQEIILTSTSEEILQGALSQLSIPVGQFIYVHPHLRFPLGKLGLQFEKEKELLKSVFLLAKHLKSSLHDFTEKQRNSFLCITRLDGALGTQNPGTVSIGGGALFGLTKSLNLEWPNVFCRTIDLAPTLDQKTAANKIIQELYDADQSLTEASYDDKGNRFTLSAELNTPLHQEKLDSPINAESVFLVTGGARGVTADCVKTMATTFKSSFILVGRSKLTEEPSWSLGITDSVELKRKAMEELKARGEKPLPRAVGSMCNKVLAQREIKANLEFIHEQGAKAFYLSADVTDAESLKNAVSSVLSQTGPVTGIIHGAGRLADKLIENKTPGDFDAVYDVKVKGLLAAAGAVDIHKIKQVVLFSSVAGFYGNVGQSDYAMANEVLNRAAYLFKKNHPDIHVVSINWGAWDAGMVSPGLKKIFKAHGVSLVPSEEGPIAMLDQLSTKLESQVQVILGGTLPLAKADTQGPLRTYTMWRQLRETENPFLQHHMIQGNAVLPIIHASNWMAQSAVDFYPGFSLHKVKEAKLFKGIVFDGSEASAYGLKIQELEKSEEKIVVKITIFSDTGAKLPLNHYGAEICLLAKMPEAPILPLPDINNRTVAVPDASIIYKDGTLFHGTDFQGVQQIVQLNEKGVLLLCEHPGVAADRQGQFPVKAVNAFLTDIMYQSLLVWVRRYKDCASLPLRTEWVEVYDALPFGQPFYVALEVVQVDDFGMEADITAFDALTGKMYLKSHRAGVTMSHDLKW